MEIAARKGFPRKNLHKNFVVILSKVNKDR